MELEKTVTIATIPSSTPGKTFAAGEIIPSAASEAAMERAGMAYQRGEVAIMTVGELKKYIQGLKPRKLASTSTTGAWSLFLTQQKP